MGIVADLMVRVGADITSLETGLTKANARIEEAGAKSGKLGSAFAGAGLMAAGAITGIVGFGLAAIAKTEAAGQAAYEMSEKFGLSGQRASEYLVVGKQLGLSSEQIGKGFQFLSKNVSAMALTIEAGGKISKTTGQVYKDLGINVLDAGGKMKSADELMLEAADAFKGMKDGPEKAALSMKLFGKSGTDMLPMLNEGRKGIEAMTAAGKAQGDVMSNDQVNAAHKLFLEHKQLDTAIAGVTTQIGVVLMPILTGFFEFVMTKAVPWIQNAIKVMSSWHGLWAALGTVVGVVSAILKADWAILTTLIGAEITLIGVIKNLVGWVGDRLRPVFRDLAPVVQAVVDVFKKMLDFIGWIVDKVKTLIDWLGKIKVPKIDIPVVGGVQSFVSHPFGIGGPQGHATGGVAAYTGLHWLEQGERVLNQQQQAAGAGGDVKILPFIYSPMPPSREQLIDLGERLRRLDLAQAISR